MSNKFCAYAYIFSLLHGTWHSLPDRPLYPPRKWLSKVLQLALITKTTQPTKKWAPGKPTTAYHQKPAKLSPQTEKLSSRPSTTSQAQRSRGGDDRKLWRIIINSIMVAKAQKLPCIKIWMIPQTINSWNKDSKKYQNLHQFEIQQDHYRKTCTCAGFPGSDTGTCFNKLLQALTWFKGLRYDCW